jgi:hypothetical protein
MRGHPGAGGHGLGAAGTIGSRGDRAGNVTGADFVIDGGLITTL